jgi:uracil-DNA glycosylase
MIIEEELVKIDNEVKKCIKCGSMVENFDKPNTISFGTNKEILLLGEAPANNGWRKSGKAWHDVNGKLIKSGSNLKELFSSIGIDFIDLSFTEVVKCFPIKPKNVKKCAVNCKDYLYSQINIMRPKIVIVLGDKAFRSICGFK